MSSGIYKISNYITKDFYIGSAINLQDRIRRHKSYFKNGNHINNYLKNVCNKHGSETFIFEIIEYVENIHNLISREQHYIDTLNPKYNICKVAGNSLGFKHSEENKLKMKSYKHAKGHQNSLGYKHTKEFKSKITEINSKPFKIKSPNGEIIIDSNLNKFCRENNLNYGATHSVINGKRKSHKGWTRVSPWGAVSNTCYK